MNRDIFKAIVETGQAACSFPKEKKDQKKFAKNLCTAFGEVAESDTLDNLPKNIMNICRYLTTSNPLPSQMLFIMYGVFDHAWSVLEKKQGGTLSKAQRASYSHKHITMTDTWDSFTKKWGKIILALDELATKAEKIAYAEKHFDAPAKGIKSPKPDQNECQEI
jgi:hypothetical protein